jgi:ricin-type beta-trefoil lectin protein
LREDPEVKLRQRLWAFLVALITALGIGAVVASPASAFAGVYQIRPYGSGKCLDVTDVSYSNGAYLQLYDCLGPTQNNQLFYFSKVGGTTFNYQIKVVSSGKCLDVRDMSLSAGARIQQYDCIGYGQTNQIFQMIPSGSRYSIVPTHSWQYVTYQGPFNGATVFQWPTSSPVYWATVHP